MFLLCLCGMAAETATTLAEANRIYVSAEANGQAGTTAELMLNMKNRFSIGSWNCTLVLPQGVTYQSTTLYTEGGRYPDGYNGVVTYVTNQDGSVTINCEGEEGVAITEKDGTVAIVTVEIANTVAEGTYPVTIRESKTIGVSGDDIYTYTIEQTIEWTIEAAAPVLQGTIHFDLNGADGEYADITQDVGTPVFAPDDPEREGYTFLGWEPSVPETMTEGETTCVAQWKVNKYLLTFIVDNDVISSDSIEYGDTIIVPEVPEKEGYTFAGWTNVPGRMPAHDVQINSTYTVNQYTVYFNTNGAGNEEAPVLVNYNEEIPLPDDPQREGYTFNGWFTVDGNPVPATMPAHDVYLEAQWTINKHILKFVIDNDVIFEGEVEYGTPIVAPDVTAPEGYSFSGWGDVPATMPDEDVYIMGKWVVNSYTLTYLFYEGGPEVESESVEYGADLIEILQGVYEEFDLKMEGYDFAGWGNVPEDGKMPASDLTVWAKWEIHTNTLAFIVDNDVIWSGDVEFGADITPLIPDVPEKEGYVFAGWDQEIPSTMPDGELIITGTYEAVAEFITLSQECMTFCSDRSLDFTGSSLKAYIATEYDAYINYVTLEPITEVPAGTGVFLVGEISEQPYVIPFAKMQDLPSVEGNLFIGVLQDTYIYPSEDMGVCNYVYGGRNNTPAEGAANGFYQVWTPNGVTVPAKSAYLQITIDGTAPERVHYCFFDKNDPDRINGVMQNGNENAVFDLQGRRVSKTGKGIYIINGKKVLMK